MASRLLICVFVIFSTFLPFRTVWAQASAEPFTVRGVDVDVTSTSSNSAKDQAIRDGQRQAFQTLLDRLTSPKDRGRIPKVDGADYVRDYSIASERSSAVRYLATLDVSFNPAAVRQLLKGAGVVMIEPVVRPVVVIPVLRSNGQIQVWENTNIWRAAWLAQGKGGLVSIVIPSGTDGALPTAEQIVNTDDAALATLGGRYHTGDVLVIYGDLSGDGHKVDISKNAARSASIAIESLSFAAKSGETTDQMLARAVKEIVQLIEAQARQNADVAVAAPRDSLSVIAPVSGLEDWVSVRDKLSRVGVIRAWELVSLSRTEATLILHLAGDSDKVHTGLANVGLDLQSGDGYWLLKPMTGKR